MKQLIPFLLILMVLSARAQDEPDALSWSVLLGVNMGATTPVPLPTEVRAIYSYNPKFNPVVGLKASYALNEKVGIETGLLLESKGMRATDSVRYMHTTIRPEGEGEALTGYFVGDNTTNVSMTYLTLPLRASYQVGQKWKVYLGIYASRTLSSSFTGTVSDGYIRIGSPTGEKQEIDEASFDFSDWTKDYDFGASAGGHYQFGSRLGCFLDLNWGLIPLFKEEQNPMQYDLYNIYAGFGLSYQLGK